MLGALLASLMVLLAQQTQVAPLEMYAPIRTGTSSIEVGKEYVLATRVWNLGTSTWKGGLYLKINGEDVASESATISGGKTQAFRIRCRWRPSRAGRYKVELFYQTNEKGRGRLVPPGKHSNPQYLDVVGGQAPQAKLHLLRNAGFGRTTIELGQSSRYVASIGNSGDKDWSGVLYLKSEGKDIYHWSVDIKEGRHQDVVFDYKPTQIGTKEYTLYAQEGGRGPGSIIDGNGYSNSARLSVTVVSKAKIKLSRSMGFSGGVTTLEQGKSYRFTATVVSDKDWSGAFFLKNGDHDVSSWTADLKKGISHTISFDYTPTSAGTQTLKLYAQDGGHGDGYIVDRNGYSNPIRITVKASSAQESLQMQSAIRIYPEGESSPSQSITKGKKCIVKVSIYNKRARAYEGALCLKDLNKDNILLYFTPNPAKISAKAIRQIEGTFVARTSGSFRYGLFYKEENRWLPVQGQGTLSPEINFTIDSTPQSHNYKLMGTSTPIVKKAGVQVNNVEVGTSYNVTCPIKNEGRDAFSGEICLRRVHDRKVLQTKSVSKISSGHTEKVSVAFTPTEADYNKTKATQYELCSKLPTGAWSVIPNTTFSISIVHKSETGNYNLGVKIRKLTPDINELVPKKGDRKTILFYTFRILDAKDKPVTGVKLNAKLSTSSSGENGAIVQSSLSDVDGYVTLAVPLESYITQVGVPYYFTCLGVHTPAGKQIKLVDNEFCDPFTIQREENLFSLKSLKITLEEDFKRKTKKKGNEVVEGKIDLGIKPKFSMSWERENGRFVNPSASFGAEGSLGASGKILTPEKNRKEIKEATVAFSAGAEVGLKVGLEGEVEMNQDLLVDAPLYFTEITCRLASQLVNSLGGRWSSGIGNYLESYADDMAKVRDQLDETTSDVSAGVKVSGDLGGHAQIECLEKLMRKNQAPVFQDIFSLKGKAEYKFTNKFHNSSIPSNCTQTLLSQLKFMVEGDNAFGYSKREMNEMLKKCYGAGFNGNDIRGYIWSNKYEWEYNNASFRTPILQKVSSKNVVGPYMKVKPDINFFDYNYGGKLIVINGGVSAEVMEEYSNKASVGGALLPYMQQMSMSYSKNTPLDASSFTVSHNPLEPKAVLDFMQREYDPSKISSYRQNSSRDIKEDYCFARQGKLNLDLSFYAKEFKIGGLYLIDKSEKRRLELPFSLELEYPKFSHSYYYAAGNRMITTDSMAFRPETPQAVALVKDQVKKVYNKTIETMQDGIAKATDWALQKGLAFFSTAGDKTVEFVNSVRDYLGSLFRSAELRAAPQTHVSHIRFVIPGDGKVFHNGTHYDFSYAYPAGEATGICKQDGDEFVVISDIFFIRATYKGQSLRQAPNGLFSVAPEVGKDDLATLSLNPNSQVMLYYLPLGAKENEWQRLGDAKGVYSCSGLGNYALGVSLQQDKEAPIVTCFPDRGRNRLLVEVKDNIGIRWNSLSIVVNGEARKFQKTAKHSQVVVPLAEGELAQGAIPTIIITVEDLAHNKGSYEQYDPNATPIAEPMDRGELPKCYPNPADTYVDVHLSDDWIGTSFHLYTSDGVLLRQGLLSESLQRISLPETMGKIGYIRFQMTDKTCTQAIIRI
ncbi:MAG: hypothetical protein MR676_03955 [Porphyromonas sp.]|nr:hypothetical protein [Porphyromonas sp.]